MSRNKSSIPTILIVIIVIIILLLFVASLGTIDPGSISKIPDEYKDTKEEAKRRHKKLGELIEKQTALKIKLDKKFKRIYFFVRLGLVLLWFGILSIFYFFDQIKNVGDVLNFSQASILILLVLNFLTFGTITNLKNFIDIIKTETENWIYGKYITIEQRIEINKKELSVLEEEIKKPDLNI